MSKSKLAGLTLLQAESLKKAVNLSKRSARTSGPLILHVADLAPVVTSAHYDCVRRLIAMGLLARVDQTEARSGFAVTEAGFAKFELLAELAMTPAHTLLGKACNRTRLAGFARALAP